MEGYNNVLFSGREYTDQNFCVHVEGYSNEVYPGCSFSHVGGEYCTIGNIAPARLAFCHGKWLLVNSAFLLVVLISQH